MNRETMPERVFCTIITKSYLAYARTLAASIAEHHPNGKLYVLLADQIDDYFEPEIEPFELIPLEALPDQTTIEQLCFYYTSFELCCALRGSLHEYLWNQIDAESWIFLDSDILVCHSLESIFEQLETASILLTPHCQTPVALKYSDPHELNFIRSGLFNAGFLGLRRTEETQKFIQWFKERLTYHCFNDLAIGDPRGLFVDQLWLNLVLLYFPNAKFLAHSGANLGHWNFYERHLELDSNDQFAIDGQPLLFVHFSGWDFSNPDNISKYSPLYAGNTDQLWTKLSHIYRDKLLHQQYEETRQYPYAFDQFCDGSQIQLVMRRAYYHDLKQGVQPTSSPFQNPEYFQNHPFKLREILSIEAEVASLNLRLAQWNEWLLNAQSELQTTQAQLNTTQGELGATQAHLSATQAQLNLTHEAFTTSQIELQQLQQFKIEVENSKFWKLKQHWSRLKENLQRLVKR